MDHRIPTGLAAGIVGLALGPGAWGGQVHINAGGEVFGMRSGGIEGVFAAESPLFSKSALNATHRALHDCGITTDGFVTFVLAETDHGLSFLSLVDDNTLGADDAKAKFDSQMRMHSVANASNQRWVNDRQQDIQETFDEESGARTAFGMFTWKSTKRGDAFAWSNLELDQQMTFEFDLDGPRFTTHPGLRTENPFQFVSWNGQCWDIIYSGEFDGNGNFDFNLTVIPLPPAALLGLAGLGIASVVSRRWRQHSL